MSASVHLCYPQDLYVPNISTSVQEAVSLVLAEATWKGWQIRRHQYDINASLKVADVTSQIISNSGPVLLIKPVQGRVIDLFRERLSDRVSVLVCEASTTTKIVGQLNEARKLHESGEPHIARALVIALLLLRKLAEEQMWGGNAKGYMWYFNLAKGRGLDEEFSDGLPPVLSILLQDGLVIKKTSKGKAKYAANPERRAEIHSTLRTREFTSKHTRAVLGRDMQLVSARFLDVLDGLPPPPHRARSE